jgi:hypothetical protein
MKLISLAALFAFAGVAQAQTCGSLTVAGGQSAPLVFTAASLAANAPSLLVIGPTTGTTTLNFGPIGTLTLGLAAPFVPVPLGNTSASGGATLSIDLPNNLPPQALHAQALSLGIGTTRPPRVEFCTTNVVAFSIGS